MIKITVKCNDLFTDEEKTTDLYFHLTEAELVTLNITSNKAFSNYKGINKEEAGAEEIDLFEKLISKAYGQRTADGLFIKDETAKKAFLCSPEYSALLEKIAANEITLQDFVLGCFPKEISKKIKIDENGAISLNE